MNKSTAEGAPPTVKAPIDVPVPDVPTYPHDIVLFASVLALVGFGIVMVYSASAVYATQKFGSANCCGSIGSGCVRRMMRRSPNALTPEMWRAPRLW